MKDIFTRIRAVDMSMGQGTYQLDEVLSDVLVNDQAVQRTRTVLQDAFTTCCHTCKYVYLIFDVKARRAVPCRPTTPSYSETSPIGCDLRNCDILYNVYYCNKYLGPV